MNRKIALLLFAISFTIFSQTSKADGGTSAVICSSGICESIPPQYAALAIALDSLAVELNKHDQAFGPNNEIVKAFVGMGQLLSSALGPNSAFAKTMNTLIPAILNTPENAWNDLLHGAGEHNEIRKFLSSISVH
jgi:hypothetical protein